MATVVYMCSGELYMSFDHLVVGHAAWELSSRNRFIKSEVGTHLIGLLYCGLTMQKGEHDAVAVDLAVTDCLQYLRSTGDVITIHQQRIKSVPVDDRQGFFYAGTCLKIDIERVKGKRNGADGLRVSGK